MPIKKGTRTKGTRTAVRKTRKTTKRKRATSSVDKAMEAAKKAKTRELQLKKKWRTETKKLNAVSSRRNKALGKKGWATTKADSKRINSKFRPLLTKAKQADDRAADAYFKASKRTTQLNQKARDLDFAHQIKKYTRQESTRTRVMRMRKFKKRK